MYCVYAELTEKNAIGCVARAQFSFPIIEPNSRDEVLKFMRVCLQLLELREGQELREAAGVHGHEGEGLVLRKLVHAGLDEAKTVVSARKEYS